jgi:malonyl-CoA O-methyltransferase
MVMFSTFGPDTLKELRQAFLSTGGGPRVHEFVDMHDLGDMLVSAGFGQPVMDVERLTLTYASVDHLLRELRSTGQTAVLNDRPRGFTRRDVFDRVRRAYSPHDVKGRIAATVEVVYGHAWRDAPRRTADGRSIVRFERSPRMKP